MNKIRFINIFVFLTLLFFTLSYIYYDKTREMAIDNAQVKIDELLLNYKAFRSYVGKIQKEEIYRLTRDANLSCDYFMPQLLSSTYSAKAVNDFYNNIREKSGQDPIKIRFASDNPRNLNNKSTPNESIILKDFNDKKIDKYIEIRDGQKGKELYYAVPTQRTTDRCMKCHSDPKLAPVGLVDIYGDKNGFYEEKGQIRALLSTVYPLEKDLNYANSVFFKLLGVTFLIFLASLFSVYIFTKKLNLKNKELEELTSNLDKKVEQRTKELESEREYIKKILDTSPNIILVTDGKNIQGANKRFFDFFGYKTLEEFKKDHNCICDYFIKMDNKILQNNNTIDGETWCNYLVDNTDKVHNVDIEDRGERFHFDIKASCFNDQGDILITLSDITELKKKEQLLFEQSKLASMGEMIGNIAHQWRQPLSVISTSATGLKMQNEYKMADDKMINEMCDLIDVNAQYLSRTIDDFRNYIRGDRARVDFNLKDNIDNLLHLVDATAKSNAIVIDSDCEDDITIHGHPNELTQCFINIFNNAKDELVKCEEDERFFILRAKRADDNIIITLKDNAGGIPEDIIAKIFEPYFTTKHKSQGTGLGLHMTYTLIVEGLEGTIEVKNKTFEYLGKNYTGAEFTISIPSK